MSDILKHPASQRRATLVDRLLRPFGDVRAGEGATALLMLVNIFAILVCYAVIKTVREPLILLGGGAEIRSYAAAGQAVLLMGFVPLYSWFASRVDRLKLNVGMTLFFIINIELFALAVGAGMPLVGVLFFVWVGIFNISLIAQFWAYANDICSKESGDRLFPIIAIGMTAGAPLGSLIAGRLFGAGVEIQTILQVSAALLLGSLVLYLLVNSRTTGHARASAPPLARGGGFELVFKNRYLSLIAVLIILLNIVNTTGEYLIFSLANAEMGALPDAEQRLGAFAASYQLWVNIAAFIIQTFVTSRLVKYHGLRGALLVLPLIALGGYSIMAAGVGLAVVRWVKTAENATDYSVMNTARQLLWLPTTREEKYKAKQAVDTFFVRGGDILSAGLVFLGTSIIPLGLRGFATVNVVVCIVWLTLALAILKQHRALTERTELAA